MTIKATLRRMLNLERRDSTGVRAMDFSKLVVDQEAQMKSGPRTRKGKVIRVTEQYVDVEPSPRENEVRGFIRFDIHSGKTGTISEGLGFWEGTGPADYIGENPFITPGTEFGPWELVDPDRGILKRFWDRIV